jgi:biotin/methionine sulfoxide reductase
MERNDIQASDLSRFFMAMRQVIDPVGQSRNDIDIFAELAERLGFHSDYTEGRDEMGWLEHMYEQARTTASSRGYELPDFSTFWRDGIYEFPVPSGQDVFMGPFRRDPEANPLKTPSGKIEIFSETIERFRYQDCPPHPAWLEPFEWLGGEAAKKFPIHLLSNQPATRLHSQLDASWLSRNAKVSGRERLELNAREAASRGLADGDVVIVFNDRGSFLAGLRIVDHLRDGVAQIATGAWFDPLVPGQPGCLEKHGNPNVVTTDKGTSRLGQSSAAQTVLVEISRYQDPPKVTAFDLPAMADSPADHAPDS